MSDLTIEQSVDEANKQAEAAAELRDVIRKGIDNLETLRMDMFGFGAWSISKLKVLEKCPFQFFLKYVLKIKVPEAVGGKADTLSADVGSAAHRILELLMKGKNTEDAFKATKSEFVPKKLTEEQWVEHVETVEHPVQSFKDRMDSFFVRNPVKRVLPEMKVGVTADFESCAFFDDDAFFRGIIDLMIELENNDAIIIDHKTGGGLGSIRPYQNQLNSYKVLYHKGVSPIRGAQAGIHYIRAQDIKLDNYTSKADIEGKLITELKWNLDNAVSVVKDIGFFKHIRGSHCKWCEFDCVGCKSGELKPIELSTKKVIPIKAI